MTDIIKMQSVRVRYAGKWADWRYRPIHS